MQSKRGEIHELETLGSQLSLELAKYQKPNSELKNKISIFISDIDSYKSKIQDYETKMAFLSSDLTKFKVPYAEAEKHANSISSSLQFALNQRKKNKSTLKINIPILQSLKRSVPHIPMEKTIIIKEETFQPEKREQKEQIQILSASYAMLKNENSPIQAQLLPIECEKKSLIEQ